MILPWEGAQVATNFSAGCALLASRDVGTGPCAYSRDPQTGGLGSRCRGAVGIEVGSWGGGGF